MTGPLAVVLVAYLIRLACLWQASKDTSDLELSRGIWLYVAEIAPPAWLCFVLMAGMLTG